MYLSAQKGYPCHSVKGCPGAHSAPSVLSLDSIPAPLTEQAEIKTDLYIAVSYRVVILLLLFWGVLLL